jgi:hypothetical protein
MASQANSGRYAFPARLGFASRELPRSTYAQRSVTPMAFTSGNSIFQSDLVANIFSNGLMRRHSTGALSGGEETWIEGAEEIARRHDA